MTLSIGYAQNSISPDLSRPFFLAGFESNRRAQSVHDDLFARALALAKGESRHKKQRLVLVSLDLIGLGRSICLELASRLSEAELVIASTHTHHGPDTIGLWGPDLATSGIDPIYLDRLKETILATAHQALEDLKPAEVRAASITVPGVAKNARDPHVVDDELSLLQFRCLGANNRPVTLASFACHPETLWMENPHITSDYPHALRETVEQETGGACLFFAGALGGMMTPNVTEHTFDEANRIGQALAQVGLKTIKNEPFETTTGFTYIRQEFEIPLQSYLLEQAMQVGLLTGVQARDNRIQTETSLLRIGPTWLAFVPGELLPGLGLEIKRRMRLSGAKIPGIIGLANDELGYILPDEEYNYPSDPFRPGDHYEETMSVGPTAGSTLLSNLTMLIQEMSTIDPEQNAFSLDQE